MEVTILISSAIILFLIALWNAYFFELYFHKEPDINKTVHNIGGLLRTSFIGFIIALGIIFNQSWHIIVFNTLFATNFAWTVFDIVYNWRLMHPWYYSGSIGSGTSSFWDKILNKFDEYLKSALLLLTILWYPLNLPETIEQRGISLLITVVLAILALYMVIRFHNKKQK